MVFDGSKLSYRRKCVCPLIYGHVHLVHASSKVRRWYCSVIGYQVVHIF